jgi:hypothetical protein
MKMLQFTPIQTRQELVTFLIIPQCLYCKFSYRLVKLSLTNSQTNLYLQKNIVMHKKFGINNMGEYSDLYLKTDAILLADIFENFRNECLKTYQLDPAHYLIALDLYWDAMLKYTKIELELLICCISLKRYSWRDQSIRR